MYRNEILPPYPIVIQNYNSLCLGVLLQSKYLNVDLQIFSGFIGNRIHYFKAFFLSTFYSATLLKHSLGTVWYNYCVP